MALSYNSITSGSAEGADFTISIGSSGYTKADLDKNFGSGTYICTSSLSDSSLDIYFLNEDGTVAGYTNATTAVTTISASKTFRYVVIYGATSNDTLTFEYKTVISPTANSTTDLAIGPRITNVATTSLPNQNDTTIVYGHNFATDITATFTGTDNVIRNAKSIVRSSSTQLIVTRPDNMPPDYNPYTLTLLNPNTVAPTSSNSHKSINSISAGESPAWVTASTINYDFGVSWNGGSLSATDSDGGSSVTYSLVSGSLPSGIILDSNGIFTGTPTTSQVSATIRATDSGGNYIDRTFLFNRKPVWNTTSLPLATQNSAYSTTLSVSDDTSISSYSLVSGSLPAGLSLNSSSGVISGTPTAGNSSAIFTIRATDSNGGTKDQNLSIGVNLVQTFTSSGSWTVPTGVTSMRYLVVAGGGGGGGSGGQPSNGIGNGGNGGGGAGGLKTAANVSVTPGAVYTITIGAGGSAACPGGNGSASSISGLISTTGGGGGGIYHESNSSARPGRSGGSGGGGGGYYNVSGGSGVSGEGFAGGAGGNGGFGGGGGGGAGGVGQNGAGGQGGIGVASNITGNSVYYAGGGSGGPNGGIVSAPSGGSQTAASGASNSGAGGGGNNGNGTSSGSGGSGVVILAYIA